MLSKIFQHIWNIYDKIYVKFNSFNDNFLTEIMNEFIRSIS